MEIVELIATNIYANVHLITCSWANEHLSAAMFIHLAASSSLSAARNSIDSSVEEAAASIEDDDSPMVNAVRLSGAKEQPWKTRPPAIK